MTKLEDGIINTYIFNVFTGKAAHGNPAAVVILKAWVRTSELQALSRQLGQPVTSFVVETELGFEIRWFAGDIEINLCGHGSLAAAAAIFEHNQCCKPTVKLISQYGVVSINRCADGYTMAMPSWESVLLPGLSKYNKLLGLEAVDMFTTRDLVLVLESEEQVRNFVPNFDVIKRIDDYHALILTAQKRTNGYVLRYFAPNIGINEDIATGSAQCSLAPYWSKQLSKKTLEVSQLSSQGGYFQVTKNQNDTIELTVNVKLMQFIKCLGKGDLTA
ncbi:PhzF family phenazine biosynthesis protein [Vibrio sp. WXL103]|uniref:PhzF family phenazine biosynthesis protein n=1 Tax=Vibrio sp. WXL103 TaxID=3450710 RepID=UPI003EC5E31A